MEEKSACETLCFLALTANMRALRVAWSFSSFVLWGGGLLPQICAGSG